MWPAGAELGRMVQAAARPSRRPGHRPHPPDGGGHKVKREVAPDRIVSLGDPDMRHGRKSTHQRFDGYKLHVVEEPGSELVTAVDVTPANTPDGQVTAAMVHQARAGGGQGPSTCQPGTVRQARLHRRPAHCGPAVLAALAPGR
jgi:hypothetical protein